MHLLNKNIKQKWQIIKSITDPDKNKFDPASEISLERWYKYFLKLYHDNQINGELLKQINNRIDKTDETILRKMKEMLNCPFTKQQILSCRYKLKTSKAPGLDMIKNEVIKICLKDDNFLDVLQPLINKIFRGDRYLQEWKAEPIRPTNRKLITDALFSHHVWENSLTICY